MSLLVEAIYDAVADFFVATTAVAAAAAVTLAADAASADAAVAVVVFVAFVAIVFPPAIAWRVVHVLLYIHESEKLLTGSIRPGAHRSTHTPPPLPTVL